MEFNAYSLYVFFSQCFCQYCVFSEDLPMMLRNRWLVGT